MSEKKKEVHSKASDMKLERIFKKSEDFKSHYVTGAIGGFKHKYDFRLGFYNVGTTDFFINLENSKSNKKSNGKDLKDIIRNEGIKVSNTLVCEVIMSEPAIRELYQFIGKELKALEKSKEKIQNENLMK